jgi:putative ABC transport system permease protein
MPLIQNIQTAFRALFANKLRSALTILGIAIGVTAVVALLAIGNGATDDITSQLEGSGTNLLTIFPGGSMTDSSGVYKPAYLTYRDYTTLADTLTNIVGITPAYQGSATVTLNKRSLSMSVIGTNQDYIKVNVYKIASGRTLTSDDSIRQNKVAVLGASAAKKLSSNKALVGETIKINNLPFTVVGILKSKGASGMFYPDDMILIPLETGYSKLFGLNAVEGGEKTVHQIAVSASSPQTLGNVSSQIIFILRHQHKIEPGEKNDFHISNQAELLSSLEDVTNTLTIFLGAIGAISLLVGGIGIMNITLISVKERTREIGLRKAVGARKSQILFQFLVETTALSLTGGVTGVILGIFIAWSVTYLKWITARVTLSSILMAFFFSLIIGLFFGIYPAFQAAKLHPMEALRSE